MVLLGVGWFFVGFRGRNRVAFLGGLGGRGGG